MQNKGLVRLFAIALSLVCIFYLSFSFVTSHYNKKAKEYANGDKMKEYNYLDSIADQKVWLWSYTLKECREKEINLGLDLKGGMNVTLEVSVADIIRSLSDFNQNPTFNQAVNNAIELQKTNSQEDFVDLFVKSYTKLDPQAKLATIFSTFELKDRISLTTSNADVVKVLKLEVEGAISNSFNVLRQRIDRFGVVQPNIQKLGNGRILIELPGIKEPERVRKLLQGSANLEFWETYDFTEIYTNIVEANKVLAALQAAGGQPVVADTSATAATAEAKTAPAVSGVDSLKAALGKKAATASDSTKMMEQSRKENPLFALLQPNINGGQVGRGPVVGMALGKDTAAVNAYFATKQVREVLPRDLGLRWAVKSLDEKSEVFQLYAIKITNRDGRAPLGGEVVTDARKDFEQTSAYANVSMTMNAEGAKTWARMTKDNIGKCIAIVLDGYVYSAPVVNTVIEGGSSQITGNFTVQEAEDLANTLKSGKMPAPARIVQEDVVGPSLGQEAINNGLWSFVIAFIFVLIYMILYYGLVPGLIADIALSVNVFFLMGILASFQAVLTLPGIAGIVLTLGMAVDGNVLIYERIREELNKSKVMKKAIVDGFSNAISAIVDANVTTLIAGIVLAVFGSGPILGFATTLIIGIITSFVTSVFLTRLMLEMYANRENAKPVAFTTKATEAWFQNTKIDFIGKRKTWYIVSGIVLVICLGSLATRGLNYGIDFSGGRNYVVRFDQAVKTDDVRNMLEDQFKGSGVSVISIGDQNQVRISTKYKIDDTAPTVGGEIETKLYNGLKPLLKQTVTEDAFVKDYIKSSAKVGPTIADDIKTGAIWAIIVALIGISLYIFIRFNDFAFSIGALASLVHDVAIILGVYSIFYTIMPFSMEMDQAFIAAILTYVGFSVNDTVVIFDRIRENIGLYPKRKREDIMNESLNETLSRTFSTSASVLVVMIAIFVWGGETIRGFIFALLIGTILGVYSTLFVAVPLAHDLYIKRAKKKALKAEAEEKK